MPAGIVLVVLAQISGTKVLECPELSPTPIHAWIPSKLAVLTY
jgi:hypothetical protein